VSIMKRGPLSAILTAILILCSLLALPGWAGELRVAMVAVSGRQRSALVETMEQFERANPGTIVRFDQIEYEGYKERFNRFASEGTYDVMFWYAGDQLQEAVANELILPMGAVPLFWDWVNALPSPVLNTAKVGGTVFGLPLSSHNLGFFYFKPTFDRLGLKPPETWDQFLKVAERLQQDGITPFAFGSRFPWTAALWFDYLNLRLNGYRYHIEQLQGRQSFDDPRTRRVFAMWADLINRGWFQSGHAGDDWRGTVPGLLRGQTGMMLIGNYMIAQVTPQQRDNIGYFRFPIIDPAVPVAEDAPTDLLVVPKSGRNLADVGRFLAYMAQPDVQAKFNLNIGQLPARPDATLPDNPLLRAGAATIASADYLAQQFDRDARPTIREAGLTAFIEFMRDPTRVDDAIAYLESARPNR
jgi:multiple sugar transport system substrate-binding protein